MSASVEIGKHMEDLDTIEDLFDWIDDLDLDDAPDRATINGTIIALDRIEVFSDFGDMPLDVALKACEDGMDECEGCHESEQDFIMDRLEDVYSDIFDKLRDLCISVDWEATTRDHMMDFYSYRSKIDGKIWIFR